MNRLVNVFCIACFLGAASVHADSNAGINLDINGSNAMHNSLAGLKGRRVLLKLSSGNELSGKLAQVGDQAVFLESLRKPGEFFSAWIPLAAIDAVVFRVNDGRTATPVTVSAD